jgi:outer membrane lipoprotein-sorting protein
MRLTKVMTMVVLVCLPLWNASAQKKTQESPGSVILQNVARNDEGVQDFVVTIEANVDMERLRVPKMRATLYFKKPDKVHFDAPGFAMLPREGVVLNVGVLRTRYDAMIVGEESIEGRALLKLRLTGKEEAVRPKQLFVWVDQTHWTIARMESVPYQGRVLKLEFTYETQGSGYVLPKTLKASFEGITRDSTQRPLDVDASNAPQIGDLAPRAPRSGTITVNYLEYKVNVGLADDIFEKKENAPKAR